MCTHRERERGLFVCLAYAHLPNGPLWLTGVKFRDHFHHTRPRFTFRIGPLAVSLMQHRVYEPARLGQSRLSATLRTHPSGEFERLHDPVPLPVRHAAPRP